jgi:hypothetical protein
MDAELAGSALVVAGIGTALLIIVGVFITVYGRSRR